MAKFLRESIPSACAIVALFCALAVSFFCVRTMSDSPWTGMRPGADERGCVVRLVERGSPADLAGIRRGDVIARIQGEAVPVQAFQPDRDYLDSWSDDSLFWDGRARLEHLVRIGRPLDLELRRGEVALTARIEPLETPWTVVFRRLAMVFVVGWIWFVVPLLVLRKHRSEPGMLVMVAGTAILAMFATMATSVHRDLAMSSQAHVALQWINFVASGVASLAAVWFGLVFPRRPDWFDKRAWPKILALAMLGGLVLAFAKKWIPGPSLGAFLPSMVGFCAFVATQFEGFRRTSNPVHRRQILWVLIGVVAGTSPFVLLTESPLLLGLPFVPEELTALASVAIPVTFAFAINRWRLLDVPGLVDAGVARIGALFLVASAGFAVLAALSSLFAHHRLLPLFQACALLVGIASYSPLRWLLLRSLWRGRGRHLGTKALLSAFLEQVGTAADIPGAVEATLRKCLGVPLFAVAGPAGLEKDPDGPSSIWLHANLERVAGLLAGKTTPIAGHELAELLGRPTTVELESCAFLEVPSTGDSRKWFVAGPLWSPGTWTRRDLELVSTMLSVARPLAQAIDQRRLAEQGERDALERSRQELERRVEERTEELERANRRLREAVSSREDFLAHMSHELRTPLAAVLGCAEAVREGVDGPPTEAMKRRLLVADRNGRHLLALIQDILDFTRGRAGRLPVERVPCDPAPLVVQAVDLARPRMPWRESETEVPLRSLSGSVLADPLRVRQILTNLLANGFRHGGGDVEVAIERRGDLVAIDVMDRGRGIPSSKAARLFRPFERLDAERDDPGSGTGIGLALSKQLAIAMGGDLQFHPRPGGGSIFRLLLEPSREPVGIGSGMDRDLGCGPACGSILVVEDDADLRTLFVEFIRSLGWEVEPAADAESALVAFDGRPRDAIVTDIGLPGMDGLEMIRRIRSRPDGDRPAILVLTGMALPGDASRCLEAGADAYLTKPVVLSEAVAILASAVARRARPVDPSGAASPELAS